MPEALAPAEEGDSVGKYLYPSVTDESQKKIMRPNYTMHPDPQKGIHTERHALAVKEYLMFLFFLNSASNHFIRVCSTSEISHVEIEHINCDFSAEPQHHSEYYRSYEDWHRDTLP